jgi:hypothetical protein
LITSAIEATRHRQTPSRSRGCNPGWFQIVGGKSFAVIAQQQLIANKANPIKAKFLPERNMMMALS